MAYSSRKRSLDTPKKTSWEYSSGTFSWTLYMPEQQAAYLGAKKPKARIESQGFEPIYLAAIVARQLRKQLKERTLQEPASHAELLYDIKQLSGQCAYQKILDMISRREYSSDEALSRLIKEGFTQSCAQEAVERALGAGLINNKRFADSFIRSKIYMGWGPIRIERELSQRGIDPSAVVGWPEDYLGSDSVSEAARDLLASKSVPSKNAYQKLVRYLVSKGYSLSVAKSATLERLEDLNDGV